MFTLTASLREQETYPGFLGQQERSFSKRTMSAAKLNPTGNPGGLVVWTFACTHEFAALIPACAAELSSPENCPACRMQPNTEVEGILEQRRKDTAAVEVWKTQVDSLKKNINDAREQGMEELVPALEEVLKICMEKWMEKVLKATKDQMDQFFPYVYNVFNPLQSCLDHNESRLKSLEYIVKVAGEEGLMNLEIQGRLTSFRKDVGEAREVYENEVEGAILDLGERLTSCLYESKIILEEIEAKID